MKNKNKINENTPVQTNRTTVTIRKQDMNDPNLTKNIKNLGKDVNVNIVDEELDVLEPEAVIAPKDDATIKYLSNVIDNNTGEISQPFNIADKNYQMVRGMQPNGEIVLAVMCLEDSNIYEVDKFEKEIALPMKEMLEMEMNQPKEDTYEGYKHFFVNKETNEVRKFKTIEEMLSCGKMKEEEYMPTTKFKRYMTEKLFGKRNRINELGMDQANLEPATDDKKIATGGDDMQAKSIKLMDIIDDNPKVQNAIKTIKQNPKAQAEVIVAFAELVGVPRSGLNNIISQIKDTSKQQMEESIVITKNQLLETVGLKKKVIKTIKVKDIK